MTKIVPAILVADKEEYLQKLQIVRQLTDRFSLDIIDGEFVNNKTISLNEIERTNDLKMDVHLMVNNPQSFVDKAVNLYAHTIIIQFECGQDLTPFIDRIKKAGLRVGISINPQTSLNKLKPFVKKLDYVQLMGYQAGFAGQRFDASVLNNISKARQMFCEAEIALDGGVSQKNAKKILTAGFDIVNINTLIFNSEDPLSQYSQLLEYVS